MYRVLYRKYIIHAKKSGEEIFHLLSSFCSLPKNEKEGYTAHLQRAIQESNNNIHFLLTPHYWAKTWFLLHLIRIPLKHPQELFHEYLGVIDENKGTVTVYVIPYWPVILASVILFLLSPLIGFPNVIIPFIVIVIVSFLISLISPKKTLERIRHALQAEETPKNYCNCD